MNIAILLYQGVTALDAIGPYEVLSSMPDARVHFVAKQTGVITSHSGVPCLNADLALWDMPTPDVFVLPGCPDPSPVCEDEETITWIQQAHEKSTWSTSVCTGALILGAAGILKGLNATTHWMFHEALRKHGAKPTLQRVVREGKVITAAGVSSGIDMALSLAAAQYGDDIAQEIQLILEYDPLPPFDSGSPAKAPARIIESLKHKFAHLAP